MKNFSKNITIEICANSVESCIAAQRGGAQRVELCDNLYEGGTTPSLGTVRTARKYVTIDLFVIVRPRGGDFLYSDTEYEIIKSDIEILKNENINGIVIGFLNENGTINTKRTAEIVQLAKPMKVTFHRAFDMVNNPFEALEDIISCECDFILTSGLQNKAVEGLPLIKELVKKAAGRIEIMPGSGIGEENFQQIVLESNAQNFHLSLRKSLESNMLYRNVNVKMGGLENIPEYEIKVTDTEKVKKICGFF